MNKRRTFVGLIAVIITYSILAVIGFLVAHPPIGKLALKGIIILVLTAMIFLMGYISPWGDKPQKKND